MSIKTSFALHPSERMLRNSTNMSGSQNGRPAPTTSVRQSNENERPPHPGTRIPSSKFIEHTPPADKSALNLKEALDDVEPSKTPENTNEVEDFDKLLADLEAEDRDEKPVEEHTEIGTPQNIPDALLQTEPTQGLSDAEVKNRRSTYGPNQLKEQERSHIKHFASFFVGPIQFMMMVSLRPICEHTRIS